jgi:ubiquinone/menaquinone biosynthesis C-methylase UbiE
MPDQEWWEVLWPDPARVVVALGIAPGMEVVDLCAGDGWFTLQIAKIARHVIAIDIDAAELEAARNRLTRNGVSNCDYRVGDAYDVALLAGHPVDFVFLANTFHGVPDRSRLVSAVRETLKPGGRFAIVNWHRRPREETKVLGQPRGPKTELRLSPSQTIESVVAGGLASISIVELPPYHYGAIFERLGS